MAAANQTHATSSIAVATGTPTIDATRNNKASSSAPRGKVRDRQTATMLTSVPRKAPT